MRLSAVATVRFKASNRYLSVFWKTSEFQPCAPAAFSISARTRWISMPSPKYFPRFFPSRCMNPDCTKTPVAQECKEALLASLALVVTTSATACFLVRETVLVPVRIEAQILEHLQVFFYGLIQRREVISNHQCAGARCEHHSLHVAQIHRASARDHDFLPRQNEPETRDRLQDFHRRQWRRLLERRAGNRVQDVNRHNICADFPQREGKVATVRARLAHANDSTGTNLDAGVLQEPDGRQTIIVSVRCALVREKAARSFQVMPVTFQPRFL